MGDSVVSGYGNPLYRYEDLLMRRHLAALAGQHRNVQRLTKQLNVFRAAFDLPAMDDEPTGLMRNHRIARDPKEDSSMTAAVAELRESTRTCAGMPREEFLAKLVAAEQRYSDGYVAEYVEAAKYDRDWMRKQTVFGLAYAVRMAGEPAISRKRSDGITTYAFDSAVGRVQLTVADDKWCAAVAVDGKERPLEDFRPTLADAATRGIPESMVAAEWDGCISAEDAQRYATAWVKLARELAPTR